jgi:hypothetical protein
MKNLTEEVVLTAKTVFTFDGVKAKDGAPSTGHPTTSSTTNSTYIFNCLN